MMKWGGYTPEQSMGILRSTGCGQERSGGEKERDGKVLIRPSTLID